MASGLCIPQLAFLFALFCSAEGLQVDSHAAGGTADSSACIYMANHDTHFTARVNVGVPPQPFDLVADTGSSDLIIQTCRCQQKGNCEKGDKCFVAEDSDGLTVKKVNGKPAGVVLGFGSGDVAAVMASDVASVGKRDGQIEVEMTDGILLMTDNQLDFGGPFEGIFALGLPDTATILDDNGDAKDGAKTFLQRASISAFSICIHPNAHGVLRMGITPPSGGLLGGIGAIHWALEMDGAFVGGERVPNACVLKSQNAKAACGAIPDSGTTAIMGPTAEVEAMISMMCDQWPKCKERDGQYTSKSDQFQDVLYGCADWPDLEKGLAEIPSMGFGVKDVTGDKTEMIKLKSKDYVMLLDETELMSMVGLFKGFKVPTLNFIQKRVWGRGEGTKSNDVCLLAMSTFEYETENAGKAWILGLPLFYTYRVGYDMSNNPPGMFFEEGSEKPCGECGDSEMLSIKKPHNNRTAGDATEEIFRSAAGMWRISQPPRFPTLDTSRRIL